MATEAVLNRGYHVELPVDEPEVHSATEPEGGAA